MKVRMGLYEKAMPESFSFIEKLTLTKRVGFDYMEISIDETEKKLARIYDSVLSDEIAAAVRGTGVPIKTMCLSGHRKYPLGGEDPRSLEIMEKAIEFAGKLGIRIIQLAGYDVYYEKSDENTVSRFAENLKKSVELAAAAGVMLGFETMETPFMNTVEKAMKYVRLIDSPYLTVYPDLGNVRNATEDYIGDIKSGKGSICAAHLKETKPGVFRDLEYGQGRVDFDGCIKELLGQGVGMYTCEFWYDGKTDPEEYVRRNKAYVDKIFARYR
ncbi:MAG: L-ribulose-5-phosphate 3-epimerase [Oscillospiraceae bacterium]|nr:L-ribulose-5-phosphate 3-epimerase [Oscillospiraceae bacterium]